MPRTPAQIRAQIADTLPLDLVGPSAGHELEEELLFQSPSRWYLTGFLVPYEASEAQKTDETSTEEIATDGVGGGSDDDASTEQASARKAHFPSSMGVSVIVPVDVKTLNVRVCWGDYTMVPASETPSAEGDAGPASGKTVRYRWKRRQCQKELTIDLTRARETSYDVEAKPDGLRIVVSARKVAAARLGMLPPGARAVSVFLVNHRKPSDADRKDEAFAFQAGLTLSCDVGFCPRPNLRGRDGRDWDDQVADLQYRDTCEYAVGHGVATHSHIGAKSCRRVETTWIPRAQVEKVVPASIDGVELRMEQLARITSGDEARTLLGKLVEAYTQWITKQRGLSIDHEARKQVAGELMSRAETVCARIDAGIKLLAKPDVLEAFRIANGAMAAQARRRNKDFDGKGDAPTWRPFQIAFLLVNLRAIAEPAHADREVVDLLFFPTGGGKTEAYLGLAAFALVLRRLRNDGLGSAGMTVLMRYTLRLLTLDQLGRAAALICALELERRRSPEKLGPWPFEIGLWVGQAATPNRMGRKGDNDRHSARAKTIAFQNDDRKPSPIPLESCPWCDTKFKKESFVLLANGRPNQDQPTDLRVQCLNRACDFFSRKEIPLPVLAVDEPIYRRLPAFLIATIDKFASLPWVGRAGALFGRVDRSDAEGFYGPADPGRGRALERRLLSPDLIIQDELHLISGPLGTMAGLYETAIDALSTRDGAGAQVRPKVVASTATVRRAERQIRALFARSAVDVFPPPGPDLRDSFFAKTVSASDPDAPAEGTRNARLYLGVAAQGRSMKVVLLRVALALLASAQRAYDAEGGKKRERNPADPYMTLVGYFNSLRELGGSRRIVEDEVRSKLTDFGFLRKRVGQKDGLFKDRKIAYDVVELTSRESTSKVSDTKRRLGLEFANEDRVDVALATNMISVGLDILRLGLMLVLGQPKTAAEYIQATSRVGRDDERPGLVVTLLNIHKPRDRSHYERFEAFHGSFYRAVEATSVTPFAARAVDRGLAGVTVSLVRHLVPAMTPARGAGALEPNRSSANAAQDLLASRAASHDPDRAAAIIAAQKERVRGRVADLLDAWNRVILQREGSDLQYAHEEGGAEALLHDPLDPDLAMASDSARKFRVHRSLRDVEPNVNMWIRSLGDVPIEPEEVES